MKEKIIDAAIKLIADSGGNTEAVTVRKIAENAGIGVGLINYHFGSKERLIEAAVERIISGTIYKHRLDGEYNTSEERTKATAKKVADFLWDNKGVSRISILSDFKNPKPDDNSMKSVKGVLHQNGGGEMLDAFLLVSCMQAVFLKPDIVKAMGIDTDDKAQRDKLMETLVEKLF